jgi:hypothetical protein
LATVSLTPSLARYVRHQRRRSCVREITGMARQELVLEAALPVWTLPKARAKAGRDVPRPLPPMALSIIRRRLESGCNSIYVFPSPADPSQPLTARAPSNALRRSGEAGRVLSLKPSDAGNREARSLIERATLWRASVAALTFIGDPPGC